MYSKKIEKYWEQIKGDVVWVIKNKNGLSTQEGDFIPKNHWILQKASNGQIIANSRTLEELEEYLREEEGHLKDFA